MGKQEESVGWTTEPQTDCFTCDAGRRLLLNGAAGGLPRRPTMSVIGAAALLGLGASFQVAVPAGHTGVATIFGKVQMEVAASPNTKTIIVGSGKDGLPIILNPGQ